MHLRTRDPVFEQVCALLLGHEGQHIAFHIDWLGQTQSRLLPFERALWNLQFEVLFTVAAQVSWIDHREALKIAGGSRCDFFRERRRQCIQFLAQLAAAQCATLQSHRATATAH